MDKLDGKFWMATLAAFVTSFVLNFIVHGVILASDYAALQGVYRPHSFEAWRFILLLLAQLITAGAMAWLYRFGIEPRPYLGQGLRFGLLAAGVSVIPLTLINYAVTRITAALTIKQLILETLVMVAMAVVIAWMHRN
jgi:hypothetical protein